MKTVILAVCTALVSQVALASGNSTGYKSTKETTISLSTEIKSIIAEGNIQLVLLPAGENMKIVETGGSDHLAFDMSKGTLHITRKDLSSDDKVVVYLPAANTGSIELTGGASVSSEGNLSSNSITVKVGVGSKVNLKSYGKIKVEPADDCEFVLEK
jgi:hypothetical protein